MTGTVQKPVGKRTRDTLVILRHALNFVTTRSVSNRSDQTYRSGQEGVLTSHGLARVEFDQTVFNPLDAWLRMDVVKVCPITAIPYSKDKIITSRAESGLVESVG